VSDDQQVHSYLRRVRAALRLPRDQRRRAVEEIRNHLDDSVAEHMRNGAPREDAIGLAISELGQPGMVAAEFNANGAHASYSAGVLRWLPLLPPLLLFVVALGFLASSVEWLADGSTVGERVAQQSYLWRTVTSGALSFGAYFAIRRVPTDPAWRWGAWACMCLALLVIVAAPF
jgi:hypothetical protein